MEYPPIDPMLPVVAVDFDGVLAESRWPDPSMGPAINEGLDLVTHYYNNDCEVVVFTARPVSHLPLIRQWLESWNIGYMVYDVTNMKPRASLYVDDRGWRPPWA